MKDIKTKHTTHDIKALDKSTDIGRHIKNAYIRSKEQADQIKRADCDSPTEYAENKAQDSSEELAYDADQVIKHQGRKLVQKTRNQITLEILKKWRKRWRRLCSEQNSDSY